MNESDLVYLTIMDGAHTVSAFIKAVVHLALSNAGVRLLLLATVLLAGYTMIKKIYTIISREEA